MQDRDGDFATDLARGFGRRGALALLASGGAAGLVLALYGRGGAEPNLIGQGTGGTCVKLPEETAGPFPADGSNRRDGELVNVLEQEGVLRSDLRDSFAGLTGRAEGVALTVDLHLVAADAGCADLAGHAVYLWHCDAEGRYSLYDLPEVNYLRGMQVSDAAGRLRFQTILPGCYAGRWPHLHFEVFASPAEAIAGGNARLTSQFALPGADCAAVYAGDARYWPSMASLSELTFETDMIFGRNTPEQQAAQMLVLHGDATSGFRAEAVVALRRG